MPGHHQTQTATVIQFPRGGRAGYERSRFAEIVPERLPVIVDDAWYHQEAIESADRDRRN